MQGVLSTHLILLVNTRPLLQQQLDYFTVTIVSCPHQLLLHCQTKRILLFNVPINFNFSVCLQVAPRSYFLIPKITSV